MTLSFLIEGKENNEIGWEKRDSNAYQVLIAIEAIGNTQKLIM